MLLTIGSSLLVQASSVHCVHHAWTGHSSRPTHCFLQQSLQQGTLGHSWSSRNDTYANSPKHWEWTVFSSHHLQPLLPWLPVSLSSRHLLSLGCIKLWNARQSNTKPSLFRLLGTYDGAYCICFFTVASHPWFTEPIADSESQLAHLPLLLSQGGCFLNSVQ